MTGINLLPYAAPIRSSVCQRTEFPKRTMISGRCIFFLPFPSPLSFFSPRTYRKGYYFYSPQSSTVIKSKMAATTTLQTRRRFCPPKICLHCRLHLDTNDQILNTAQDAERSQCAHRLCFAKMRRNVVTFFKARKDLAFFHLL